VPFETKSLFVAQNPSTELHTNVGKHHAGMCHTAHSYNTPYCIKRVFHRIELVGPDCTIANLPI